MNSRPLVWLAGLNSDVTHVAIAFSNETHVFCESPLIEPRDSPLSTSTNWPSHSETVSKEHPLMYSEAHTVFDTNNPPSLTYSHYHTLITPTHVDVNLPVKRHLSFKVNAWLSIAPLSKVPSFHVFTLPVLGSSTFSFFCKHTFHFGRSDRHAKWAVRAAQQAANKGCWYVRLFQREREYLHRTQCP